MSIAHLKFLEFREGSEKKLFFMNIRFNCITPFYSNKMWGQLLHFITTGHTYASHSGTKVSKDVVVSFVTVSHF